MHIPLPDPLTNPSTLARQSFYAVRGTPSWFVDGDPDGGGANADQARSIFDRKVDPVVQKHFDAAAGAQIDLRASRSGSSVKVIASVSKVTSKSDKVKLHLVLVEESVRYSGENGLRFHEMTVRGVAGPPSAPADAAAKKGDGEPSGNKAGGDPAPPKADAEAASAPAHPQGFPLKPGKGGSVEYTFDLATLSAEGKAHLEDYEKNTRKGEFTFREKKYEVGAAIAVVAFVQDEATKKILQAVYVEPRMPAGGKTTN